LLDRPQAATTVNPPTMVVAINDRRLRRMGSTGDSVIVAPRSIVRPICVRISIPDMCGVLRTVCGMRRALLDVDRVCRVGIR
jgi:hypothetical protein